MHGPSSEKGHRFESLSRVVIGACFDVQRQLGVHRMEVDYQRALELALGKRSLEFEREVEIAIAYDGVVVTKRRVDFVIRDGHTELLLETKARSVILPEDMEQWSYRLLGDLVSELPCGPGDRGGRSVRGASSLSERANLGRFHVNPDALWLDLACYSSRSSAPGRRFLFSPTDC